MPKKNEIIAVPSLDAGSEGKSSDLENQSLKVIVDDLEDRLAESDKTVVEKEIALAKMQNHMIHKIDESIQTHDQLVATQDSLIKHLDENLSVQQKPAGAETDMAEYSKVRSQLRETQDRIGQQDRALNDQYKDIKSVEDDLKEANEQVDRLMDMKKK